MMERSPAIVQLYLRLAIAAAYIVFGLDRLGVWGKYGEKNISWGDWEHFIKYAREVMSFLPASMIPFLAIAATIGEIGFGILLLIGKWTRPAAFGSGILALLFAVSMAISFGIVSPLSYSVFTVSAASFSLACFKNYRWSLDSMTKNPGYERF